MTAREADPVEPPPGSLADAVADARVLVTTGAGGVGKTTTAAALGLAAARRGRRALVITIDPARRLAQALGLDALAATPQRVPADAGGQLHAMMLDMQSTFDDLIDRHASSPERAATIKANRIYQTLSSTLSGTHEYMAMEKLHELHELGAWDVIVVDTPPTRNALDFLDAPARMTSFLDGTLLKLLLKPAAVAGKGYLKVVGLGATTFMRVAGKVTGMELLEDLGTFFRNFEGMYDGFKQRAEEVLTLLRRPSSRFVVVATPQPPQLREARFFLERLEQEGLHLAGVVVNRLQQAPGLAPSAVLREAADALGDDADQRAVAAGLRLLAHLEATASRERDDVGAALRTDRTPVTAVPLQATDVHDLPGLATIADVLASPMVRSVT